MPRRRLQPRGTAQGLFSGIDLSATDVYAGATGLLYIDGVPKAVGIDATFGYLGGTSTTLALPDFSALAA